MIQDASPGGVVQASIRFTDLDGDPVAPNDTVFYKVYDHANRMIISGAGIVDPVDAATFTATLTFPDSLPPTIETGKQCNIRWQTVLNGEMYSEREYFNVVDLAKDPDSFFVKDIVIIPGAGFIDRININHTASPPVASYRIIDEYGVEIVRKQPSYSFTGKIGTFQVSFTAEEASRIPYPRGVQQHYVGNWVMSGGDLESDEIESRPVYFLTPQAQTIVLAMHKMLDEGVLRNVKPFMTWTTGGFLHHVLKGFNVVNSFAPRVTAFSIYNPLPVGLVDLIEKAAMVSALSAQLSAVQSTWDFQGAGVQLNVDRVSAISDLISRLQSDLDKGPEAKKTWLNSGKPVASLNAAVAAKTPISASKITVHPDTNIAMQTNFEAVAPSMLFSDSDNVFARSRRRL